MKALLSMVAAASMGLAAYGNGVTQVELGGSVYSNITKAYLSGGGRVVILFPNGGTTAAADKLPPDFLNSWGISNAVLSTVKTNQVARDKINLDLAIQNGFFREIDGVVYDTRKPQSSFLPFRNVKMIQYIDGSAIVDPVPDDPYSEAVIYVKHFPAVGDTEYINFNARPAGTYSYVNKNGNDRTVRAYDIGTACSRLEIPPLVLSGAQPFEASGAGATPREDVLAKLPDRGDLQASGSGFFISEDGYLITNNHVVKNARNIKVKTGVGVFPAEVIRVDTTNDLALLKVTGKFKPLSISTNEVQLGDPVFTIGFPDMELQGMQPKYTDGKISSLSGLQDDPTEYQISVPVQPGNSGGPLVDMNGTVKGVIVARLDDMAALKTVGSLPQNVNYAVKGGLLRTFLSGISDLKLLPVPPVPDKTALVPSVQQAVAIVLIY